MTCRAEFAGEGGERKARQGMARKGMARHGIAKHGMARQCKAWQGNARHGMARQGKARQGRTTAFFARIVFQLENKQKNKLDLLRDNIIKVIDVTLA